METKAKDRQTLLDMAVQLLGSVEGVFALAERNGLGIVSRLADGQRLTWEVGDVVNVRVATLFEKRGLLPATELEREEWLELLYGTGDARAKKAQAAGDGSDGLESVPSADAPTLTRIFADGFDTIFA